MRTALNTRWRRPLLLLFLAATLLGAWWHTPDAAAARQLDDGFKRALTTFASARALDAVISAAQGTELSLQPLGVGLTFAPGQVLDPINDLVEQFSGLMLAASVSFGVQRVLISVGDHWLVSALLSAVAVGWVALKWRDAPNEHVAQLRAGRVLARALVLLLFARFAIPIAVLSADAGFRWFMADDYAAAHSVLDRAAGEMEKTSPAVTEPPSEPGVFEKLKRRWSGEAGDKAPTATSVEPSASRFERLQRIVGDAIEHIVRLIVVFVMQTLVLPVITLWALLGLLRRSLDR